jgi:hypothetical protein
MEKSMKTNKIEITKGRPKEYATYTPKFMPKDWRLLRLTEPVEVGDFYWSKSKKHWVGITNADNEFPRYLPVIRREDALRTVCDHIATLKGVGDSTINGTFAGNPEVQEACRFACWILDEVPIIIDMSQDGCVSGDFNEWPQLRPGCRDVAEALSLRQSAEERDSGRSPISASQCCIPRRFGSS